MVEIARSEVGSQILLGIGYLDTFLERTLGYSVMIILINVIFLRICDTCHALSDELQLTQYNPDICVILVIRNVTQICGLTHILKVRPNFFAQNSGRPIPIYRPIMSVTAADIIGR